jgi:hypothetical protein
VVGKLLMIYNLIPNFAVTAVINTQPETVKARQLALVLINNRGNCPNKFGLSFKA